MTGLIGPEEVLCARLLLYSEVEGGLHSIKDGYNDIAHINQGQQIVDWFGQQEGKTTAQLTVGDWLVEYSVEVDTEEPGAHLTLTDKLCKSNCQAE